MLLLQSLQQFDIDAGDFLLVLATCGLLLLFMLAALCGPLFALSTETVFSIKKKTFWDKCALQIAQMSLALGMFVFVLLAACAGFFILQSIAPGEDAVTPMLPFVPPLAGLILLMLHLGLWSKLKKARAVHLLLGWTGALLLLLVFVAVFFAFVSEAPMPDKIFTASGASAFLRDIADTLQEPFILLLFVYLFCTGVAAAAGFSQLWLIVRRHKADYGRDYYAFAMRYCAKTAMIFVLVATVCGGIFVHLLRSATAPELMQPLDLGVALISGGLPLCCCLLWLSITKSETPLRHKPGAFFACIFLFVALCAQIVLITAFPAA